MVVKTVAVLAIAWPAAEIVTVSLVAVVLEDFVDAIAVSASAVLFADGVLICGYWF